MKRFMCLMLGILVLPVYAGAADQVTVTFADNIIQDTLAPGIPGRFIISVANDAPLGGISLGFIISSTADYHVLDVGGFPVTPAGNNFIKGIPDSRWMSGAAPDGSCWDLGGTNITYDPNSNLPDQFLIGGAALTAGLEPGPLQPMLEVWYKAECWSGDYNPRMLCIDSMLYPPAGDFVFVPGGTPAFYVTNSINGCFPVGNRVCGMCPQWEEDNPMSMMVHLGDTGQVTVSAYDFSFGTVYYHLVGVTGGMGMASVGLNDGVVTYVPDSVDVGAVIKIEIEATNPMYDPGACLDSTWTIDLTVTDNHPPTIDCGRPYHYAAIPNVMSKNDITVEDPDVGDTHTFYIASFTPLHSGTLDIDPATGALTFIPGEQDLGMYEACVGVTDGVDSAQCCFTIEVLPPDCCAGDVNFDASVNIGDAVFLITYIFKGGYAPQIMNFADVNADCVINIADAVYLVNYIFKGGSEPQIGCYYQ